MTRAIGFLLVVSIFGLSAVSATAEERVTFLLAQDVMAEEVDVPARNDPNSPDFVPDEGSGVGEAVTSEALEAKPAKQQKQKPVAARNEEESEPRDIPLIEPQNETRSQPEVTYVTGGIGEDEKQSIESAKADYNLYVMSASVEGEFVGDARVTILGGSTEMLSVVAGPLLYVKLPPGSFTLDATLGQQTKHHAFTIAAGKGKNARIHLGWKKATVPQ